MPHKFFVSSLFGLTVIMSLSIAGVDVIKQHETMFLFDWLAGMLNVLGKFYIITQDL